MVEKQGRVKRDNTHYLEKCASQTAPQHYIFMCARMICVCACFSQSVSQPTASTGLVIRGKQAFHRSHRTMSETGNGTHTLHLNQRKTACGLLCITYTLTHTCTGKPVWAKKKKQKKHQTLSYNPLKLQTTTT